MKRDSLTCKKLGTPLLAQPACSMNVSTLI